MKKEILEQAVLDYINEKFKDKLVDKRVQTFFTYSELVDTVVSFAALLNKNIEELEKEDAELRRNEFNARSCLELQQSQDKAILNYMGEQLTKATELLKEAQGYIENEDDELYDKIEQLLREIAIDNDIQAAKEGLNPLIIDYPQQVKDDLKDSCPNILCEDCTRENCTVRKLGLVPTKEIEKWKLSVKVVEKVRP